MLFFIGPRKVLSCEQFGFGIISLCLSSTGKSFDVVCLIILVMVIL